jgi:hypothetical protein
MYASLSAIGLAGSLLIACSTAATANSDTSGILGVSNWDAFADSAAPASFAWAGEDETYSGALMLLGTPVADDESVLDAEMLTGLPAPEPPAVVLAGMAFGGAVCGRSLLMRRRKAAGGAADGQDRG